jgi:hypothetical protein
MDVNSCRGRTPIILKWATLWSRSSESDSSEIESKNGFDEHHISGVHNRFSGFEIIQRVREDREGWGKKLKDTLKLYTLGALADFWFYSNEWWPLRWRTFCLILQIESRATWLSGRLICNMCGVQWIFLIAQGEQPPHAIVLMSKRFSKRRWDDNDETSSIMEKQHSHVAHIYTDRINVSGISV